MRNAIAFALICSICALMSLGISRRSRIDGHTHTFGAKLYAVPTNGDFRTKDADGNDCLYGPIKWPGAIVIGDQRITDNVFYLNADHARRFLASTNDEEKARLLLGNSWESN